LAGRSGGWGDNEHQVVRGVAVGSRPGPSCGGGVISDVVRGVGVRTVVELHRFVHLEALPETGVVALVVELMEVVSVP
jgi:hypothetical protein